LVLAIGIGSATETIHNAFSNIRRKVFYEVQFVPADFGQGMPEREKNSASKSAVLSLLLLCTSKKVKQTPE